MDSNFAVSEFSFELPTALLFRSGAPPRGFRTPVDVHWSEQAIMLCKVSSTDTQGKCHTRTANHDQFRQAAAFRDTRSYSKILSAVSPAEAKRLGRAVRGFDEERWERLVCAVAKEVVAQKFAKVEGCAAQLRGTGSRVLAEASETDRIWGIGMRFVSCTILAGIWVAILQECQRGSCGQDHPDCAIPGRWRGSNVLGWALMEARAALAQPSANEEARQVALAQEDQRLQAHVRGIRHRCCLVDYRQIPVCACLIKSSSHSGLSCRLPLNTKPTLSNGCCDQARSQVHVEKAPPKHSLAAMAAVASRRERQQDSVMGQMQTRAAEVRSLCLTGSRIPRFLG